MCNVTTPCSIKKTLGVGLKARQRAHYLAIYHVSNSKRYMSTAVTRGLRYFYLSICLSFAFIVALLNT